MDRTNPIIKADFPDPDVIRVDDVYYMLSTTMHFRPGAVILRSFDLIHWEIVGHVFEHLGKTPEECMQGERCNYGRGMWAGSLRYHNDKFYVCFSCLDTDETYIYEAEGVEGPWKRNVLKEYRHHPSLLFDEDGRVYLVSGYEEVWIRELLPDCSAYKKGGLERILLHKMQEDVYLGYEGSHVQKIHGKYYLFVIYWPKVEPARRTQLYFVAECLDGEFAGGELLRDDMDYHNQGVAQGGLVETLNGKWYAMLYQDHGAVGRIPVLVPVRWEGDVPVLGTGGKTPKALAPVSSRPYYQYQPVYTSDDFKEGASGMGKNGLKPQWEFNHVPDEKNWWMRPEGGLVIRNAKISTNVVHATNMLTQRMMWPGCAAEVTVDASGLKDGDVAGLCALQGCYGLIGIMKEYGTYYLVVMQRSWGNTSLLDRSPDYLPGNIVEKIRLEESSARIRLNVNFEDMQDEAEFYYQYKKRWKRVGEPHKLVFRLDHFTGCRFGLFNYATGQVGGEAVFKEFRYIYEN
ncbi:MAG: glycoside hydrolase 43 family protein [Lachnospiraceae bacterium]|nr:glycoside hydrolase 43 family protein [Lachnospiraceae bacterium]